jgi:hypothetical protein
MLPNYIPLVNSIRKKFPAGVYLVLSLSGIPAVLPLTF